MGNIINLPKNWFCNYHGTLTIPWKNKLNKMNSI